MSGPAARWLRFLAASLLGLICATGTLAQDATPIQVSAARVWPATDYTRITLESETPVSFSLFVLENPHRLVLDLTDVELSAALKSLPDRVAGDDPHVQSIRVAVNRPGVTRIVLDLKRPANPQAFVLKPAGNYKHRLVLDVYPLEPADPLLGLLFRKPGEPGDAVPSPPGSNGVAVVAPPDGQPPPSKAGNSRRNRPAPQHPEPQTVTIAIDPGHGGEDPGATGRRGTLEKDVTLSIARRLKALIDKEDGMQAVLIRDGDYYVPLQQRVVKARRARADLFVSIHADAYVQPQVRGSSVYALSERGATSAAARWLAARENEADLVGGVNLDVGDMFLKQTLLDLSQTATINDSLKAAKAVLGEIGAVNRLHKPHVEQAGFAVLKAPDIPSILVETAFISNLHEEKRLRDVAYQKRMAKAILDGIKAYFAANPPLSRSKMAQGDATSITR